MTEAEKFNKINKLESEGGESMYVNTDETFELMLEQEKISFYPVGGDLEKIGVNRKEEIVLLPPQEDQERFSKNETIGFLVLKKGESVDREVMEKWCKENGWRLATGFELASLHNKLWKEAGDKIDRRKKVLSSDQEQLDDVYSNLSLLKRVVAIGDSHNGNYVSTTIPNWDWMLTLYSGKELNDSFKFAVVKS